jgi:hypothetical protein
MSNITYHFLHKITVIVQRIARGFVLRRLLKKYTKAYKSNINEVGYIIR